MPRKSHVFALKFDRDLTEAEQALVNEAMLQVTEQLGEQRPPLLQDLYDAVFTPREIRLILNCQTYEMDDPAGLPGHNLIVLVSKIEELVGMLTGRLNDDDLEEVIRAYRPAYHQPTKE